MRDRKWRFIYVGASNLYQFYDPFWKIIYAKSNIAYFFGPLKSPSLLPQLLVSTSSTDYDNPLLLSLLSHPFPPTAQ